MSWEIEYEEVDKAEGVHRFGLIERNVITRSGDPARFKYQINLGTGTDGLSCSHCNATIERTHALNVKGVLEHVKTGEELKPFDAARAKIAELNAFHGQMDAYIQRHGATLYKGPGKTRK
jgi:hypothetical protein